ncbi:hypothetical protein P7C70_g9355, partial [Phenoliferia sp. Uapishka_3]
PPLSSPPASLSPSNTKTYPLTTASLTEHLESLEAALGQARDDLNTDLTEWKVAVGAFEVVKKKPKSEDGDEDEDGEE